GAAGSRPAGGGAADLSGDPHRLQDLRGLGRGAAPPDVAVLLPQAAADPRHLRRAGDGEADRALAPRAPVAAVARGGGRVVVRSMSGTRASNVQSAWARSNTFAIGLALASWKFIGFRPRI